jgi:hypothetical protein
MKIVILASLTQPATANYLIRALREAGNELFVCSDVASPLANLRVRGAVDVARLCGRQKLAPELLLFIEGGTMRLFPTGLEHMPCLTAWYGIDTHMDYAKHLRIGRLFDVTFVAQKQYVEFLRRDGLKQVLWLPLGFAPELIPSPMPARELDIAHVGSTNVSANPPRHALLAALRQEFRSYYFGPASPQEMGRLYASARLVFNRSVNNDVNMRFFEAAGAGAVLVTDPIIDNGIEGLFDEGAHYVVYRDAASLLGTVRALLDNPARCDTMSQAARQRVLERHTYRHRADALLDEITRAAKLTPPEPDSYFSAFLTLNMLGPAMHAAGRAVIAAPASMYRRIVGTVAATVLHGLAVLLDLHERLRNR